MSRFETRSFMREAQRRVSRYVRSDIGPTDPGRWQIWQFACRIGATSFEKVTSTSAPSAPFTPFAAGPCPARSPNVRPRARGMMTTARTVACDQAWLE